TLDDYVADCRRLDRELRFGRFVYPDGLHMVRGRSTTVRAAVTLGAAKPPAQLLHSSGSTHTVSVLVSCQVEAQLTGDAGVFEISDTGWQSRSLLTSKTAEWIWFVDPRRGGDQTLAVNVRPVVRIEERDGGRQVSSIVASTQTFDISVAVQVPPEEAAREGLDRTKVLLLSVGGLLAAVAVVVSAALGLWRIRGRRETGAAGDPGSDGDAAGAG
ncbi:MAG: hypothetical protein JWN54_942, partial [Mycobacterium sp.]|nr:hypothetical protein [Mycobacterium sp.]